MKLFYKKNYFDDQRHYYDSISTVDFQKIVQHFPIDRSGLILDLGSGTGAFSHPLSQKLSCSKSIGIDLSIPLLKMSNITCCCADSTNLPFSDEKFDYVVAAAAFHHFPSIPKAISEAYRTLKKGGYFFAYEPNKYHPHRLICMTNPLRHLFYQTGDHAISPYKFSNQLKHNGFYQIKTNYLLLTGNNTSSVIAANKYIIDLIKRPMLKRLLPFVSPWFVISGKK